jgi:hypothetical protein
MTYVVSYPRLSRVNRRNGTPCRPSYRRRLAGGAGFRAAGFRWDREAGLRAGFAAGRCFAGTGFFAAGRAFDFGGAAVTVGFDGTVGGAGAVVVAGGGGATTGAGFGGSVTIDAAGPRTREGDVSTDIRTRSKPSVEGRYVQTSVTCAWFAPQSRRAVS